MTPNFQSSFIPKGPVTEEVFKKKKTGVLGTLAIFLFICSIIVSVGIYVYKGMLKSDIKNLQAELAQAESDIDKETIDEMANFSKKLDIAKLLVAKHNAISNFLDLLSSSTVKSIQFTEFDYNTANNGDLTVKLRGKADSYSSVALQEDIFSKISHFKSMVFSDLSLSDKGGVVFDLAISVDSQISVYSP